MSFLKKAMEKINKPRPEISAAGNFGIGGTVDTVGTVAAAITKEKPLDFDTRTHLADGRPRIIEKNSLLQEADTLLLIDDSGSMIGSYWNLVSGELALITDILIQNDPDGVDLFFLNHKSSEQGVPDEGRAGTGYLKVQNPDYVLERFNAIRPTNGTPTPERLGLILKAYVRLCEIRHQRGEERPRPLNIIVWTDGVCSDTLKSVIADAARDLDRINAPENQCGIQFFQVGNEPGVATWLEKLDDDLKEEENLTRDMVDTKKYSDIQAGGGFNAKKLIAILIGALSDRHDRMKI